MDELHRPKRGRPPKDPSHTRVVRGYSLHPDTIKALDLIGKEDGKSPGEVVDELVRAELKRRRKKTS